MSNTTLTQQERRPHRLAEYGILRKWLGHRPAPREQRIARGVAASFSRSYGRSAQRCIVLHLALYTVASINGQTSQPARSVVPWVELNAAAEPVYDNIVAGCRTFGTVTSRACVSVGPEQVERLKRLRGDLPGLTLIPGIVTNQGLSGRIDGREGWKKVATAVRRAVQICEPHVPVVIEMELALANYLAGKYVPDWTLVEKGLAELPAEVTYWWYPGVFSADPTIQARELEFLHRVIAALPHTVLVSPGWWGRDYPTDPSAQARQRVNEALAPCINLVDCDPAWPWHWEFSAIPYVNQECPLQTLLYSGQTAFRTAAEQVSHALYADVLVQFAACRNDLRQVSELFELVQQTLGEYRQREQRVCDILCPSSP